MALYNHLLAAVDLTTDSSLVAKHAARLAELFSARLSLAHAVEFSATDPTGEGILVPPISLEGELAQSAHHELRRLRDEINLPHAEIEVAIGNTRTEIVRIAREKAVDLLILGAHERHGLAFLLGNHENAIIRHAPCDVLAIRIKE